jgi:hypothetical protein
LPVIFIFSRQLVFFRKNPSLFIHECFHFSSTALHHSHFRRNINYWNKFVQKL